jgi:hypothetical protein
VSAEETRVVVRRGGAQDVRFLRDMLHHAYYWKERAPDSGPGPVALYVKATRAFDNHRARIRYQKARTDFEYGRLTRTISADEREAIAVL